MPAECVFTLPNGRKCRGMASTGHAFCRHHGAPRKPRRPELEDAWNRRACWLQFGHEVQQMTSGEIPVNVLYLLQSLLEDRISDRFAGRCLRTLLQRLGSVPLVLPPPPEEPAFPPPPPRSRRNHRDGAAESEPEPSQDQLVQWALSTLGAANLPHSQPSDVHSRPQAPAPAAVR